MKITFTSHRDKVMDAVEQAIDRSLDQMGARAVQYAQNAATVDTGNMRASISHERFDDRTEIFGTNNTRAPIKPVEYAPYVELGTRRQRAQPFIRPAAEDHASEYQAICEAEFGKIK